MYELRELHDDMTQKAAAAYATAQIELCWQRSVAVMIGLQESVCVLARATREHNVTQRRRTVHCFHAAVAQKDDESEFNG